MFLQHIQDHWPSFVTDFLLYLTIATLTILGAYWIFRRETERHFRIEKQTFKRSFAALIAESSANCGSINTLLKTFNPTPASLTSFNLHVLSFKVAERILTDPLFYKYSGDELMYALNSYITQGTITNRLLDHYFGVFKTSGMLQKGVCADIVGKLEDTKKYLFIVQLVTQFYIFGYQVKMGPSTPIKGEVMDWLKNKNLPSNQDLEKRIQELSCASKLEQEQMAKALAAMKLDH